MYTRYFGLREPPFSLAPDPRYLYLSRRHQEALAHLVYGVTEGGGFVQLTGDVGTGKTMLIRTLLERLPSSVDVALVLYPILSVREFVSTICDEFHIEYIKASASLKSLIDALNSFLLENHAKGRRSVLIIDEAQNLSRDVLEQVRLLTNLETSKEKLLQVLLVGQPELNNMLAQDDLRQLAQRITARYSLKSLYSYETSDYITHRCRVANAKTRMFSRAAMRNVHKFTNGVPRLINIICDRALLGTYARGRTSANAAVVRRAVGQVGISPHRDRLLRPAVVAPLTVALALFAIAGWQFWPLIGDRLAAGSTPVTAKQVDNEPNVTVAQIPATPPQPAPAAVEAARPAERVEARKHTDGAVAPTGTDVIVTTMNDNVITPPRGPTLAQVLADPTITTDTESALARLFSYWGLDYFELPGATGCARALKSGLQCLFQSGTWNNLRQLNRPAVIELLDARGRKHHVLVAALDGDQVASEFGQRQYSFPISEVDRYWYGQYLMLWKPPLADKRVLRRGVRGQSVVWLRNTLARYNGKPATTENEMFDQDLEAQVKQFQRDHQLDDDGMVGNLTLIQLNNYDPTTAPPILRRGLKAKTG